MRYYLDTNILIYMLNRNQIKWHWLVQTESLISM